MEKEYNDNVLLVKNLPHNYLFIDLSQDVEAIKETIIEAHDYDSFFVKLGEGDYEAVYGMYGIVPYMDNKVYKIL